MIELRGVSKTVESGGRPLTILHPLDLSIRSGEFLAIEYAHGDKLYVPVAQLALVSRYSGADDEHAPLHSLSSEAWDRAKHRAAEKVRDAAAELLAIHAQRAARQGNAINYDRALVARFAEGFRFEETPDQQAAIDAVLASGSAQPAEQILAVAEAHAQWRGSNTAYVAPGLPAVAGGQHRL